MQRKTKITRIILLCIAFFIIFGVVGLFVLKARLEVDLPDIKNIAENPPRSSQIFDAHGQFIASVQLEQYRVYTPYSSIPDIMTKAIIAAEDERFMRHKGYDLIGIFRAIVNNVIHKGGTPQGGSTITQQLARDLFLNREHSYIRKIKEILLATKLEEKYTKEEILEFFMNYEYFGYSTVQSTGQTSQAWGVEAAARTFFGKTLKEINAAEAAIIAGALNAPSLYTPWADQEVAKERGNFILQRMLRNHFITEEEYKKYQIIRIEVPGTTALPTEEGSIPETGTIVYLGTYTKEAKNDSKLYFIDYVKKQLQGLFPDDSIVRDGLKIYTTLDVNIQNEALNAMNTTFTKAIKDGYFKENLVDKFGVPQPQGQMVALNPKTGEILAMIGGRNYLNAQYNRATAYRQPGSLFKIFDYTAGIDQGVVGTGTMLTSEQLIMPDQEKVWQPEEWTGKGQFFGPMSVREALVRSSNICAIKVAERVGWDLVAYYAQKMGIQRYILPVPSMAIGSLEVSPLEMSTAFSVLANGGLRHDPYAIRKITTNDDKVLFEITPASVRVIKPETAYLMNDLFQSVFSGINGWMPFQAAGKTGTSEDFLSGWFVGYTPDIVICSWVGRDSREVNLQNPKIWGSSFAAPMVKRALLNIYEKQAGWKGDLVILKTPFPKVKDGLQGAYLCRESGLLALDDCPPDKRVYSTYLAGFAPTKYCMIHRHEFVYKRICTVTGKLANEYCTEVEEKAFLNGTEPTEVCTEHGKPLRILLPSSILANQQFVIQFQVNHSDANRIELYIDDHRTTILEGRPFEYTMRIPTPGKHHFQAILRKNDEYIDQVEIDVEVLP
ncbi:transglycosylase domain-containing protein [bacterium]|nr:transglycosylase domain-containing protein [bacterium]